MAKKKNYIPETEFEVGQKIQFKFNYIKIISYGEGFVTARYGSGAPFVDRVTAFSNRVEKAQRG